MELTQHHALHYLVELQAQARLTIRYRRILQGRIEKLKSKRDIALSIGIKMGQDPFSRDIAEHGEKLVETRFELIKIGETFCACAPNWDRDLPRAMWLRALGVNESEWNTDEMNEYGSSILNVVSALNLEHSATVDEDILWKPLNWCFAMYMMNITKTNKAIGKAMHEKANELFDGAFGEWREPSILKQCGV